MIVLSNDLEKKKPMPTIVGELRSLKAITDEELKHFENSNSSRKYHNYNT